jgi:uncharacterized protein (DUF305 family)
MKFFGTALMVLLIGVVVGACGVSSSPPQPPRSADQPVITGVPVGVNSDDVAFATSTAASYGQTAELTSLVPGHSTNPEVIALASDIDDVQRPDLETMKVFLVQWDSNSDGGSAQGGQVGSTPGMVDDATMAQLGSLRGKDFDTLWLRTMVGHQQGAVTLARAEVAKGANVDAVATAKRLVGTYQAQIGRMQRLLPND